MRKNININSGSEKRKSIMNICYEECIQMQIKEFI